MALAAFSEVAKVPDQVTVQDRRDQVMDQDLRNLPMGIRDPQDPDPGLDLNPNLDPPATTPDPRDPRDLVEPPDLLADPSSVPAMPSRCSKLPTWPRLLLLR